MLPKTRREIREPRLLLDVRNHQGLLRLPDPPGRIAFDRRLRSLDLLRGYARFENVQAHHVLHAVVQDQSEEVKIDYRVKARGKVVEQRGKIALLRDGLAHFEQSFE